MNRLTQQEYEEKPPQYRGVINGKPALLHLDETTGSTVYEPIEIVDDPEYIKVMHITTDGKNRLCGADSPWAAHVHYADQSFIDGVWCQKCRELLKESEYVPRIHHP